MTKGTHDNDNLPILARHPRLLAPVKQGDGNRQQDADRNPEHAYEDASRELTVIEDRIKFLNWIEFALNKRTVFNDNRQVWLDAGRSGASKRIS
jgi:hypothetical protein